MDLLHLLQQGSAHVWLYIPVAIVLGALHGLEPGHSKTMMAAFIIAIRGTVLQATLLGLSAAISHSLIIWVLAAIALQYGSAHSNVEQSEPYFLLISGVIVVGMALWTITRLRKEQGHHHHHHHQEETKTLQTPDGDLVLEIFEDNVPPVFRIPFPTKPGPIPTSASLRWANGTEKTFIFVKNASYWESDAPIPEPHQFTAWIQIEGPFGKTEVSLEYTEDADHHHHRAHGDSEEEDAHARAHAEEIRRRFTNRDVTTAQIILFGLTGGLMPCPAAVSILIVCLQLKRFTLGFSIVAAFSLGLAITMISVGVLAAWGFQKFAKKSNWFSRVAHRAPYISSCLLIALGLSFVGRGLVLLK